MRLASPAVSDTKRCGPAPPPSGTGRTRQRGESGTPCAFRAALAISAACCRDCGGPGVSRPVANAAQAAGPRTPRAIHAICARGPMACCTPCKNGRASHRRLSGPREIAIGGIEQGPFTTLHPPPQDDPERHHRDEDDHGPLYPDALGRRREERQGEPDGIEEKVEDDAGQQTEVEVQRTEADRRQDQLHGQRERWLCRIRRVPGSKDTTWTMKPRTRKRRRLPNLSPIRAAPASGTARNRHSSQKPA